MSSLMIVILAIAIYLILSFNGMPVAFSFGIVGCAGLVALRGLEPGMAILGQTPYSWATHDALIALPLFILMGSFVFHSRISGDLYQAAYRWVGRFPGGIALATNLASTLFAACCGVSMAGTATMSNIAYKEMEKLKYSPSLATGCIVAGGGLSSLIPPSIPFIMYGFLTKESIAQLFMAGLLPGLMLSAMFLMTIAIICQRNPRLGPPGPSFTWVEMFRSLKGVLGMGLLFVMVFGGLYFGVFTPSEAGAAGACGASLLAVVMRRLNPAGVIRAAKDALKTSCFVMTMIIGANIFNTFLRISGATSGFSGWLTSLDLPPYLILCGVLAAFLPLGMFLDIGAVILLMVPIVVPPLKQLGFDPIWVGVLIVLTAEIGFMTPPVGLNAFVVHGVTKVPLSLIFKGVTPFVLTMLLGVIILIIFPQISLLLPGLMN